MYVFDNKPMALLYESSKDLNSVLFRNITEAIDIGVHLRILLQVNSRQASPVCTPAHCTHFQPAGIVNSTW